MKKIWLRALEMITSTRPGSPFRTLESSASARAGTIRLASRSPAPPAPSLRTARRWPSVAASVRLPPWTCTSTPVNTGRASSVEAAIEVCSTALTRSSSATSMRSPSSGRGPGGNSSASMHLMCVSNRAHRRFKDCVAPSRVISRSWSGRVLTKSVRRRAGAVVLPSIATSAATNLRIPISRLVAVSARPSDVVSMRMLLRMGKVVRLDIARETTCSA